MTARKICTESPRARRSLQTGRRTLQVERLEERTLLVVGAFSVPEPVLPGNGFDGVVALASDTGLCSGSLLSSGRHILTAAHCLTNKQGQIDRMSTAVIFVLPEERAVVMMASQDRHFVHEDWDGVAERGFDIAILELPVIAPSNADRYAIHRGTAEIGTPFTMVGYGKTGTGETGQTQSEDFKRRGQNEFGADRTGSYDAGRVLVSDFDDGTATYNTLKDTPGLAADEATVAEGDSGGPALIGQAIAGVASYVPLVDLLVGGKSDFGDRAVFTRVSHFAGWIDTQVNRQHDLVLDMSVQPAGNDGSADTIIARQVASNVELLVNGSIIHTAPRSALRSLTMVGSEDNETITVDSSLNFPVTMDGMGGDDSLTGGSSNDTLRGGAGNDTVIGGTGQDRIEGGPGNDSLTGGDNFDTLLGDEGDDSLDGGAGDDLLLGIAGNDSLFGGGGYDVLEGGEGNDTLAGGTLNDRYVFGPSAAAGADEVDTILELDGGGLDRLDFRQLPASEPVVADLANDEVLAQHGRRTIRTEAGMSRYIENVSGGQGDDRIAGNDASNNLRGEAGNDTLIGLAGQDTVEGGTGDDSLDGGDNFDTLLGGPGDDALDGGSGNDQIRGEAGNDTLFGGVGADSLAGGDGNDYLDGGRDGSRDTLEGGLGADTFVDHFVLQNSCYTYYRKTYWWNPVTRTYQSYWVPVRYCYTIVVSEDTVNDYQSIEGDSRQHA